jgi:TPP-dependent indolepyruvate ferredoxin oxidoreductase alpha subunit
LNTIAKIANKPLPEISGRDEIKKMLTPYQGIRRIALCAGCPHRASGYIMKKATEALGIE